MQWESSLKCYNSRVEPKIRVVSGWKKNMNDERMARKVHRSFIHKKKTESKDSPSPSRKWQMNFPIHNDNIHKILYVIEFNWVECKWSHCSSVQCIRYISSQSRYLFSNYSQRICSVTKSVQHFSLKRTWKGRKRRREPTKCTLFSLAQHDANFFSIRI